MPAPAARMRSARLPCGTSSSSSLPLRYRPSNTCESAWRGNEQMILRTRPAFSSAARPVSPLPALLLTIVRSRAPCAISASISSFGWPAPPKPPIITVAPSRTIGQRGFDRRGDLVDQVVSWPAVRTSEFKTAAAARPCG